MHRHFNATVIGAIAFLTACGMALAGGQEPRPGTVIVPPSNVERPQDIGKRSHTNFLIFIPAARSGKQPAPATSSGPSGETPPSLACVYQTASTLASGCPIINSPTSSEPDASGGSNVIAIVDAYDDPTAASDFQTFSQQFGLPYGDECGPNKNAACFTKVYATGSQPKANCSWAQEESLDIEWSHAMAPYAQIILVEAASNSNSNLMQAVSVANNLVSTCDGLCSSGGTGEVSMSWGSSEFSTESTFDSYFTTHGVTYFASSGDSGGQVIWPSASPNVVSAGGTTIGRDSSGSFTGETTWTDAGGGPSSYEAMPGYQQVISDINTSGMRGTPDLSFDANPASGVSVYDSTSCQGLVGWLVFGGTSVAAPSLSGIVNDAGAFDGGWDGGSNSSSVQSNLYSNYGTDTDFSTDPTTCSYTSSTPFYDITTGSAGTYPATACWDFASGIGSDRGLTGFNPPSSTAGFSLSASPSTLTLTAGSTTSATSTISMTASGGFSGTVTLSASAPSGSGLTVSLSPTYISGSGTSTLTVGAGTATAGTYTVAVTGTSSGFPSSTTDVTVTVSPSSSSPTVSSVTLSPSSVTGGTSSTGTVTLTAAASSGGAVVSLTSSNTSVASVPSSVTVSAGSTSASFTVTTSAVTTQTSVTITASYNNSSASATLTVKPPHGHGNKQH